MVSVLAFYSDDPSSNPAEVYNFSVKLGLDYSDAFFARAKFRGGAKNEKT